MPDITTDCCNRGEYFSPARVTTMKTTTLPIEAFWGFLGICMTAAVLADGAQVPGPAAKNTPEIRELLTQRVAILQELAERFRAAYKVEAASIDAVSSAETDLLMGKLELAEKTRERIKIREQLVALAQQREAEVNRSQNEGGRSRVDVLRVRALRLQALVDLARERLTEN